MKLKTIQASAIKSTFEVLKDILTDVNISFTKTGIKLLTLDTARVSLVHLFLDGYNFDEYECDMDIVAGVNLNNLYKLLKTITNKDVLTITVNNTEYMELFIENVNKGSKTAFKLKLLDINEDEIGEPDVNMENLDTLPSVDFQRLCRDMGHIASEMKIHRHTDKLDMSCEGDFAEQLTSIDCLATDRDVSGTYSLKYLNTFTKATGLCANMQLMQDTENKFLVIRYNVADLGFVNFYLATKTSDEY